MSDRVEWHMIIIFALHFRFASTATAITTAQTATAAIAASDQATTYEESLRTHNWVGIADALARTYAYLEPTAVR
jgi:hypothetical protein